MKFIRSITFAALMLSMLAAPSVFAQATATPPVSTTAPATAPTAVRPPAMAEYRRRLPAVQARIPEIIACAEAVAQRWVEHPDLLMHYPFGGDTSNFTMEFIARAGGIDNAQPNTVREKMRTPHDVIVVGPRSWEKGGAFLRDELAKARKAGWLIVAFGSRQGAPADVPTDFLIDNGAAGGGDDEAAVNQIVNVTQGWMWSAELAAALSRRGFHPGILRGMPVPGAIANNKEYQISSVTPRLYPCTVAVAAGDAAKVYLGAIDGVLADLNGADMQRQIGRAADFAAEHVRGGHALWASSFTHVLDGEVFLNNRAPTKAFRGISCGEHGEEFTNNLKPGDLLLFFGEWTLNLPWRDYLKIIRSTKADFIPSLRPGTEPLERYDPGNDVFYDFKVPDALMVLEQHWPFENASVPIPFPPGKMAPVSGVYVCLLYRTLDEAIAARLDAR